MAETGAAMRKMSLRKVRLATLPVVLLAPVLLALAAGAAAAQDTQALMDRLNRLERDMNQLQRQVYRGGSTSGAPVPMAPAGDSLGLEMRMDQLENQFRTLTGQIEETNYAVDQMKQRLDKLVSDIDFRLGALENPGGDGSRPQAAAQKPGARPSSPPNSSNPAQAPSRGGMLVAPGEAPAETQQPQQQTASRGAAATAPAGAGGLPSGTPQEQYNYAFGLLRQADYPAAEQALRAFVQRYPNDSLAGNAQYWLGETYYVRKDYTNAASAFADGYKRYPQSGKAADNLLKLGLSLGALGQKKEACLTFGQLAKDFPNASANIKEKATQERQHLGCS